jgi:hypothetical protein
VEEGAGAIKMLVEAVKDGQWSDVQMWLQTGHDTDELVHSVVAACNPNDLGEMASWNHRAWIWQ